MKELSIVVDTDHLERVTRGTAIMALSELVWNALDAEAMEIQVIISPSTLAGEQAIDGIEVLDDGHGMTPEEVPDAFGHLGGSWKANSERSRNRKVRIHGRAGQGRFKALALGDRAEWSTVATVNTERLKSVLWIERSTLKNCSVDEPESTTHEQGTQVAISRPTTAAHALADIDRTYERLTSIFALRLQENRQLRILLNDRELDPSVLQLDQTAYSVDLPDPSHGSLDLTVIEWDRDVDRALHLCDMAGASLHMMPPGIQAPTFNFTAYARWRGFREYEHLLSLAEMSTDIGPVITAVQDQLREHFRQKAVLQETRIIEQWKEEEVYPFKDEGGESSVEEAERQVFDLVALSMNAAVPSFDRSATSSKRVTLKLLREAVQQTPSDIRRIIDEVISLDPQRRDELIALLDYTDLSKIISSSKMVTDRIRFIEELDAILFEHGAELGERAHLHPILNHELWIFGDHYQAALSERGLTEVLRQHLKILGRDEMVVEPVRTTEGKIARLDLMLSARVAGRGTHKAEHLVVELKAPTTVLGMTQYGQLQDYATAVLKNPRFASTTTYWEFWLIGNTLDASLARIADIERPTSTPGLIDQGANYAFRVMPWSVLIDQHKRRLAFMEDVLRDKVDAENTFAYLKQAHAQHLPECIANGDVEA